MRRSLKNLSLKKSPKSINNGQKKISDFFTDSPKTFKENATLDHLTKNTNLDNSVINVSSGDEDFQKAKKKSKLFQPKASSKTNNKQGAILNSFKTVETKRKRTNSSASENDDFIQQAPIKQKTKVKHINLHVHKVHKTSSPTKIKSTNGYAKFLSSRTMVTSTQIDGTDSKNHVMIPITQSCTNTSLEDKENLTNLERYNKPFKNTQHQTKSNDIKRISNNINEINRIPCPAIPSILTDFDKINNIENSGNHFKKNCFLNAVEDIDIENLSNDMEDLFQDSLSFPETKNKARDESETLNIEIWQTCIILDVLNINFTLILKLQSATSSKRATCILKDAWTQLKLEKQNKVNVRAVQNTQGQYEINNDQGLLVLIPDLLISGTTLMGFMWCQRKSIINYIYGGAITSSKIMTFGFLIHELLQEALKSKVFSVEAVRSISYELIKRLNIITRLYECEMKTEATLKEIQPFVDNIAEFIQTYILRSEKIVHFNQRGLKQGNWDGYITKVRDIEENIWCPHLGMKGKIDVSVSAQFNTNSKDNDLEKQIIPLELKTGRAIMSPVHLGQVTIYNMMLRELGYSSPSGLLLYLRENVVKEVKMQRREERDLMILRNQLTYYLTKKPSVEFKEISPTNSSQNNTLESIQKPSVIIPEIPETIASEHMCRKCDSLTICSFLKCKLNNEDKPLEECEKFYENHIKYLTSQHTQYFKHWIQAIHIETSSEVLGKPSYDIWELKPIERENKGKSLSNLIVKTVQFMSGYYYTLFVSNKTTTERDFEKYGIVKGQYLVVSTLDRIAIAAGFVTDITKISITLSLERNLFERYSNCIFCLDSYDTDSTRTSYFAPLLMLMENSDEAKKLREIIIERKKPLFRAVLPKKIVSVAVDVLKNLNQMQQSAIFRTLAAKDYILINGMPGTGKTQTIVALIEILYFMGKSVLITSHTHSAVDNVLEKILKSGRVKPEKTLKLGSELRTNSNVQSRSENILIKKCSTVEELEAFYDNISVVGVTCFGSYHPLLDRRKFDVCIVDESTQVIQPIVLKPLFSSKVFVLVGDPEQLPPIVRSECAKNLGMNESLFDRLYDSDCTENLTLQYRMNKTINLLANKLTYRGQLLCANSNVADKHLQFSQPITNSMDWIGEACSTELEKAVLFLDTANITQINKSFFEKETNLKLINLLINYNDLRYKNICEAVVIINLVQTFLNAGLNAQDIGIIAPFQSQILLLQTLFENYRNDVENEIEINTIDQFQGRDKTVIIFSCTITEELSDYTHSILNDKRRLNVAVTRAKLKLIFVGNKEILMKYSPFEKLFSCLQYEQILKLEESDQFNWNTFIDLILKLKSN